MLQEPWQAPPRCYARPMIAYCADVGSIPAGSFGWARASREEGATLAEGGSSIDSMLDHLTDDIERGRFASLGLEAPLFLPVPSAESGLSRGRDGDHDRSCFAPVGASVTTLGLHELAYALQQLKGRVPSLRATLDWMAWGSGTGTALLLWEAFVSGGAHTVTGDHVQDAATGAVAFLDDFGAGVATAVTVGLPRRVFSLAGAALLWAGLTADVDELHKATLVVKPAKAWPGSVARV